MLRIYHAPGTRSVRPIWAACELGLQFEIAPVDFSAAYRDTPEWRAISPAGKLPALTDGELTLFESGAMVDYILDRYGEGRLRPPAGTAARALCQQWCWFSEATLLRPLGLAALLRDPPEAVVAAALAKAREAIGVVDSALAGRAYMLGDAFTAADIMMGYSLAFLDHLKLLDGDAHRNGVAYLARLKTREAFQRALNA
ncbi:MAG: glutathione S-transferase [Proteobacteria bacterium]|nr:glutathione S-transferase [Pseudomonadota bacterium]